MKRIRETLARLTRSSGSSRTASAPDESAAASRRPDRVPRSSTSTNTSEAGGRALSVRASDGRGPTVLYDGSQEGREDEGLDIVFVHGLYGHRILSWTKANVCWPRDLLGQDIPQARVISWGWTVAAGQNVSLTGHAEALLADVSHMRAHTARPIVFVGHGLGGLLIKEALVMAAMSRIYGSHADVASVYARTTGCLFLGTPQIRSGNRTLGDAVATTALLSPRMPTTQTLRALRDGSDAFENLHSTFLLVSRDIKVVCIREEMRTSVKASSESLRELALAGLGKGMSSLMLPKDTAAYQGYNVTKDAMAVSHADLARPAGREAAAYQSLVGHILTVASAPTAEEVETINPRNQEILDALYFDTMKERESNIDSAYGETCEWILSRDVSPYFSFLHSKDPILWISGKAGSGKSTLLKHAWQSPQTKAELLNGWAKDGDLQMACFYMFEGGDRIQMSYEGFLRSVLYQILSARRELIQVAFPSFFGGPWPPPVLFTSITNLNQGFYSLFSHMSESLRLFVFIDGIDEYRSVERKGHYDPTQLDVKYDKDTGDESWGISRWAHDSHTEIAQLITSMADKDTVKFVVSSRELPVFSDSFGNIPRIRVQEYTQKAIARYIEGRLEDEAPGLPDTNNLCQELARKSKGDILWARLVIDMVVDESLRTLRPMLNSLPAQLGGTEGLYMRIMQNLSETQQPEAYRIFHLVLRAQQPPSLVTLALAEQGYLDRASNRLRILQDDAQPFTTESLQKLSEQQQKRLAQSCSGLLEAEADSGTKQNVTTRRVVFLHQTTKEWVAREDIWRKIGISLLSNTEFDFSLLSGCVRYLKALETTRAPLLAGTKPVFRPDVWLVVANALRYAEKIDSDVDDVDSYTTVLDELDRSNQRAWNAALDNYTPLLEYPDWLDKRLPQLRGKHWAGCEPMEAGKSPRRKDFLALAVQANLVRYVRSKLMAIADGDTRRMKAQELLSYVVCPKSEGFSACVSLSGDYFDFHHDMPDSRFLKLLFDAGADVVDDDKTWNKALKMGRRYFQRGNVTMTHLMETGASARLMQNRQRWVASIKALLHHGADPEMDVEVTNEDNQSISTIAAIDLIRETLTGEPEYVIDLHDIEKLMEKRGNIGVAS